MTTSATPPQPKARDGRPTREAILRASARLMHLHGYHATSLDDVLRESGVGKGNFYHYFKSKEDLGHAILDRLVTALLEGTVDPCFSGGGLSDIRCFLDRLVESLRQRNCVGGCALGNLASELSDVHEGFRRRLAEVFCAWRERLTRSLAEAQTRGEVREDCRPETVAHFLVASLEGAILMSKVAKDIGVMEQCVGELKRYLTVYERPHPERLS
ncbi:MAG: TetR family transcriptional regulator C-terminal domain-containing protein [Candidatus Rokubacteria bacterium]|nr:TetR family transcriptional regulator C-terminal domain-containing protein [Candidatus Rokubacteria bacterium]MBI3824717.1 TetR family transcriptional regulator C-terminal domain-containing protein [Candidatus Rokubacteria bacterium]